MNYYDDFFPDEERKQWVEKCPDCGEEFLKHKGGPQCSSSCSALNLQNEHERVLPSMADYALPKYRISVDCPKDWNHNRKPMGASHPYSSPPRLEIPWYTLRIKSSFFDITAHELGHISSQKIKFDPGIREEVKKWFSIKNKNKARQFLEDSSEAQHFLRTNVRSEGGHYEDAWQPEYERIHGKLMGSPYSKYNYSSKPPYAFPKSTEWEGWD
jgi:hypothetical protein